jgi:glycerol-3-phosphate O-acyltransferase/dihydroxyacetone phosphate acyltransferase
MHPLLSFSCYRFQLCPHVANDNSYKAGGEKKRNACGAFLSEIHVALKAVTVTAPNHDVLHVLWAIRSLYVPSGVKLKPEQKLELTRRFELAYEKLGNDPRVKALEAKVRHYNDMVVSFGLKHHQVHTTYPPIVCFVAALLLFSPKSCG